ncbi:alanine--tRNA ligase-related protein [Actinoplanes sp. NPDC023936]|uniref:alanine--tRNA ligase-related protein n=1 Tax=Actinoplanes sp. NPDC023936 TaxID=3154910 RepID=UPI003401946F
MYVDQTVRTFIDFYRDRGHTLLPESTLIPPPGDPVLFTTSGMHPLTPYLEGRQHPLGRRLVNRQRCLRTTDLDEIGDDTHLTVFQMLGSWSLGDYPGPQSLTWGYELLRDGFGMDPGRLHVTVYTTDTGSLRTWERLGVPVELTTDENWWSNGPTGPCGPDSEIFVWTGEGPPRGTPTTDDGWTEVWNHVTMRYERLGDGSLRPLPTESIDTGMGLERMLTVLQNRRSVFDTDVFEPWMTTIPGLWTLGDSDLRIVVDHLRSTIVMIGDGVEPSNTSRGYVLRRLVRRVLTILWRTDPERTLGDLPTGLIRHTLDRFEQIKTLSRVRGILLTEEVRFRGLLRRGRQVLSRRRSPGPLTDDDYRRLHETHGVPRELVDLVLTGSDLIEERPDLR